MKINPNDWKIKKAGYENRPCELVELPGLEPGKTDPETVVLPLHHSSIAPVCECKNKVYFSFRQRIFAKKIILLFNADAKNPDMLM